MPSSRLAPVLATVVTLLVGLPVLGAEPQGIEVQRPVRSGPPVLPPAPGEPASEPAVAEPAPEPETVPESVPAPAPVAPAPVTPPPAVDSTASSLAPTIAPTPFSTPVLDSEPPGGVDRWKRDYVRVARPRLRGTGLMVTAGSLYATAVAFQLGDLAVCDNCAYGALERGFLAPAAILAPIGAAMRGRSDAYRDTAARFEPRNTRPTIIAGVSLAAAGAVAGIANEVMWWQCKRNGTGPYVRDGGDDWWNDCRYGVGRATLNLSAAALTAGISMVAWGLRYRRDAHAYRNARVTVAPQIGRREAMLTLAGRF
jgi:hypothetical protein